MNQFENVEDVRRYVAQLENEYAKKEAENAQLSKGVAATMFQGEYNDNLIKWQLDIKEELERIEHLLKGHVPGYDEKGVEIWKDCPEDEKLFNQKGVREILKILTWYLNKNIILSNFKEEEVYQRVHQFSTALTDFVFLNYEDFGLDTKEKIKHFEMVVMNIVNTVEAAYNRALRGGERESLRTARTVTQSEPLGNFPQVPTAYQAKKFSPFKPSTWRR